ncbi:MAG TPA: sorbosone dehydrogenase family protein [Bryobacteraceae bacterium]
MSIKVVFPGTLAALLLACPAFAGDTAIKHVVTGRAAFTNYLQERPGRARKITVKDLPPPDPAASVANPPTIVPRPAKASPQVPAGFQVQLYATLLQAPREIRTAPNGDLFVAESYAGQLEVFRGITGGGKPKQRSLFATGLHENFGIAFYPPGKNPQWVYIANTNSVVRFRYKNGDLKAAGSAETIIPKLPSGAGHWTRDLAFSADGKHLFVSVGSASNDNDPDTHPEEVHRADILEYTPAGKFEKVYAYGIRNPVGLAVDPTTGELWCSVNERDELGNDLVPDYITHVTEDGFYGWPWFYMGGHWDPNHKDKHPELQKKVISPDVLLQPHNASLEMAFYEGGQFPSEYKGDIFAAEHGSWNKKRRAGYEVIRVPLNGGHAPGEYQDFVTGFITRKGEVWGRPVGVAVAPDGSLMIADDASKSIWRVSYTGK